MNLAEDRTQKIELFKFFQAQLDELDIYLVKLRDLKPDWFDEAIHEYLKILIHKTRPGQRITVFNPEEFSQDKWNILGKYPKVIGKLQNAMLSFLQIDNYPLAENNQLERTNSIEVPFGDYVRCGYFHVYYLFYGLIKIQGKEPIHEVARQIAKQFYSKPQPNGPKFDTLLEYGEFIDGHCLQTHNFLSGEDDQGHFINKVVGCVWGESLRMVEDPELMYFFICYGDFFSPKGINENFSLTRKYTILQGHDVCDFCYHDARVHKEKIHPDQAFWDCLK